MSHRKAFPARDHAIAGHLQTIESYAGARPPTCPWKAWADPDVQAVVELYVACRTDYGCTPALISWDVPAPHWDGLLVYAQALSSVRRKVREEEEEQRKAADASAHALEKFTAWKG